MTQVGRGEGVGMRLLSPPPPTPPPPAVLLGGVEGVSSESLDFGLWSDLGGLPEGQGGRCKPSPYLLEGIHSRRHAHTHTHVFFKLILSQP